MICLFLHSVQISPLSQFVDNAAQWFRFAGRTLALAIMSHNLVDVFFTRSAEYT